MISPSVISLIISDPIMGCILTGKIVLSVCDQWESMGLLCTLYDVLASDDHAHQRWPELWPEI